MSAFGRRLVLFEGESDSVISRLTDLLEGESPDEVFWVGATAPAPWRAVEARDVRRHLGSEYGLLIFNAFDGFDPDAFAAAVGALRGGGDCVVLAPPAELWPTAADPYRRRMATYPLQPGELRAGYLKRLLSIWHADPRVERCRVDNVSALHAGPKRVAGRIAPSREQQRVIAQIERVARGHARRPLLLSADRGRGKSTALGIAAAQLLTSGWSRITVVAPHQRAVATLFRHACEQAGMGFESIKDYRIGEGELCFRSPHEYLSTATVAPGLLLVDEAASMPVGVLEALLQTTNRAVFSTTEHGYEGSGRGFRLRFERLVARVMPQFRRAHLDAPVRWAVDDPLEALVNRSLLLDAEVPTPLAADNPAVVEIDLAELAGDEPLLRAVFGLLVLAHYQTRPSDLRHLLDDPQLRLWVAHAEGQVLGVLLGGLEGGLAPGICAEVLAGRRRLRGHLLNQSLAVHAGMDRALPLRALRIQRIAVHPALQRQGIGRRLVERASAWAADEGIDLVGCAFGIDPGLMAFWQDLGLLPVRLGLRVDPASAANTLMMMRGATPAGKHLSEQARQRFQRDLPWALGAALADLSPGMALRLLRGRDCADIVLAPDEHAALSRIADGARQVETAAAALWRWVVRSAAEGATEQTLSPLLAWRVQHWPIDRVCRVYDLAGARALHRLLRSQLVSALPVPLDG